jgi:outer membrane receptor protein involved in Fe transport
MPAKGRKAMKTDLLRIARVSTESAMRAPHVPGIIVIAFSALLSFTEAAHAQAEPAEEPVEVIVTTGFRPSALTDSVGSSTIIDARAVRERGAVHVEAVLGTAANVSMTSAASRARFVQIRGVGDLEQFVGPKHYPSVGVTVDGIDLGGIASAAMLFDVDQIEVLRGPQGTRFGASALAGQVFVRSVAPDSGSGTYLEASAGDYGTASLGFAAGGALAGNLAARVALQSHRGDGYIENGWLGADDTNGYDESTLRARLHWTPGAATSLDITAIGFDSDNGYDAWSLDHTRETLSDQPGSDDLDLSSLGLTGRIDLESGSAFEAALTWLDSTVDYGFDEDWSHPGLCDGTTCTSADEFSNTDLYERSREDLALDLRWLGDGLSAGGRDRRYVLGVYAQDREESFAREYYGPFASDYAADRLALYGQIEADLGMRLELTLGLRYERFDDAYADSFAFSSASDDELHSGEIALRYELAAGGNVYALVARGQKPGGVNTEASSVFPLLEPRFQDFVGPRLRFGDEALTNVELGYKADLAEGRLGLRAAVFSMSRDGAQLESWFVQYVPFMFVGLLDTADGDNSGMEVDLDYRATDRWRLRASVGLLDTEVESLTSFDIDLDDFVNRAGIDQAKSPSWQAYLGSEWTLDRWRIALDIDANDSERFGYYHDGLIPGATLVSASLTRIFGATEVMVFARNLLDEEYAVHGLYFGNDPRKGYLPERYLQDGEPRLVGLSVRHGFRGN